MMEQYKDDVTRICLPYAIAKASKSLKYLLKEADRVSGVGQPIFTEVQDESVDDILKKYTCIKIYTKYNDDGSITYSRIDRRAKPIIDNESDVVQSKDILLKIKGDLEDNGYFTTLNGDRFIKVKEQGQYTYYVPTMYSIDDFMLMCGPMVGVFKDELTYRLEMLTLTSKVYIHPSLPCILRNMRSYSKEEVDLEIYPVKTFLSRLKNGSRFTST